MSKNKILLIIAVLILAVGSYLTVELLNKGREVDGDVEIIHELGTTKVVSNPEKVIIFDFGILETLDALEINVIGVPKASVPDHLSKYRGDDIVDVGTLFEPNFEVIYDLQPDLIIISGRQSELYGELSKLAPTIYLPMVNTSFIESFEKNLTILSQIFTKENRFTEYIEEVKAEIEELHELASSSRIKWFSLMVNSGSVSALGLGSRYDVVYNEFGVKPSDPSIDISTHGQSVTFEYISEVNPDIIFVVDRGLITEGKGTAEEELNNSLVKETKAFQNNRIIYLTPANWYISTGGYTSIKVMINEVRSAFE